MSTDMQALVDKITTLKTTAQSTRTLLTTLGAFVREHADEPAVLRQLATDLESENQQFLDAIVANTPSAP